jgi:hypothetical protein
LDLCLDLGIVDAAAWCFCNNSFFPNCPLGIVDAAAWCFCNNSFFPNCPQKNAPMRTVATDLDSTCLTSNKDSSHMAASGSPVKPQSPGSKASSIGIIQRLTQTLHHHLFPSSNESNPISANQVVASTSQDNPRPHLLTGMPIPAHHSSGTTGRSQWRSAPSDAGAGELARGGASPFPWVVLVLRFGESRTPMAPTSKCS